MKRTNASLNWPRRNYRQKKVDQEREKKKRKRERRNGR